MIPTLQEQKMRLKKLLYKYPKLKWKENRGERYPVTKAGISSGSLWFRITKSDGTLVVSTNGDVTHYMSLFITQCAGSPYNVEKAHRDWVRVSFENVENIAAKFDSINT